MDHHSVRALSEPSARLLLGAVLCGGGAAARRATLPSAAPAALTSARTGRSGAATRACTMPAR